MVTEIKKLKNEELLQRTKFLVVKERKITLQILHHLQEISRRRLFAERGYSSLFKYATQELGYSDASAIRRLQAMELLTELPEVEDKIKEGALSLSVVAQAQRTFQIEAKLSQAFDPDEKKNILQSLEYKSSKAAERELIQHSSQPALILKPDLIKPVTSTHSEIRFVADQVLLDQLELIRGFLGNKNPNLSLSELITEMARISLEKLRPKAPKELVKQNSDDGVEKSVKAVNSMQAAQATTKVPQKTSQVSQAFHLPLNKQVPISKQAPLSKQQSNSEQASSRSRFIPIEVKRKVYQRDEGKCQYVDPVTGRKCLSTHAIQYGHIIPFAMNGPNTVENIRIECRVHNRLLAIQTYPKKMAAYLKLE
jgi:5-methylcytosine-specific restriction endonuclease McrA